MFQHGTPAASAACRRWRRWSPTWSRLQKNRCFRLSRKFHSLLHHGLIFCQRIHGFRRSLPEQKSGRIHFSCRLVSIVALTCIMHQQVCASSLKWFECWQLFFSSFFLSCLQLQPSSHCPHFSVICSILRLLTCASKWWAPYTPQLQQTCRSQIHLRTSNFPCLIGWIEMMAIHVPLLIGQMDEKWKLMYGVIQKVAEFATHHWSNPGISNLQSTVYHIRYDRKIWQCSNTQICVEVSYAKRTNHVEFWVRREVSKKSYPILGFQLNSMETQKFPVSKYSLQQIFLSTNKSRILSYPQLQLRWQLWPLEPASQVLLNAFVTLFPKV